MRAIVRMPEAAMYEDYFSTCRKYHVRRAGHVSYVQAIAVSKSVQSAANDQLRFRILASDPSHQYASRFLIDNVCHGQYKEN